MKQRKSKKGIFFSIDATIGMILVISIILITNFYVLKTPNESVSQIQMNRHGSDIIRNLAYNGTLNPSTPILTINKSVQELLETKYDLNLQLNCSLSGEINLGNVIPDSTVLSGERYYLVTDDNVDEYCKARYSIWVK